MMHYPHYCYRAKPLALEIILLSLFYLFASKPGKICTRNPISNILYLFVFLYLQ